MANTDKCLIWGTPAEEVGGTSYGDRTDVRSARAGGQYSVTRTAKVGLNSLEPNIKARLTTWVITQNRLGVEWPLITSDVLKEIQNRRPLSIHERADNFLRCLNAKSSLLGTVVMFYSGDVKKEKNAADELLAWTESVAVSEVITLAEYCNEEGFVEHRCKSPGSLSDFSVNEVMLRPPGYARLAELDGENSASVQAFVAMWFDDSMQDAFEKGIAPGIRDAGYEPVRIDGKEHNNKIDDEIIAEIRRSRFMVADFTQGETGARGGVYYEAGFAHGLNIPVIFTCRKDIIDKVHFDTRQYNHIAWETHEELSKRLSQRISATIGDGPLKKN